MSTLQLTLRSRFALGALGLVLLGPLQPARAVYDAAHSVGLDGTITNGEILTLSKDSAQWMQQIREQLRYSVGQLNGLSSVARLGHVDIYLRGSEQAGAMTRVKYAARTLVSWSRELPVQRRIELVLPEGGMRQQLEHFVSLYREACNEKDPHYKPSSMTVDNYWYHFRPMQLGCPLVHSWTRAPVVRVNMELRPSRQQTEGKSPEYGRIWRDGRLVAHFVFSKNDYDSMSDSDAGISTYNDMYRLLLQRYGAPVRHNIRFAGNPGALNPHVQLVFRTREGELDIHLDLVANPRVAGPEFKRRLAERSREMDLLFYNGHAGLGANVAALLDQFKPYRGQYTLAVLQGCDTFAYFDARLMDRVAAVNPGEAPTRYLDVISNAMPGRFGRAYIGIGMLDSLIARRKTYREILGMMPIDHRATVMGEEDNRE